MIVKSPIFYSFAFYNAEGGEYKEKRMSVYLCSSQEKRLYNMYMQRMHKSESGLVSMKERIEGVYVVMFCRMFKKRKKA